MTSDEHPQDGPPCGRCGEPREDHRWTPDYLYCESGGTFVESVRRPQEGEGTERVLVFDPSAVEERTRTDGSWLKSYQGALLKCPWCSSKGVAWTDDEGSFAGCNNGCIEVMRTDLHSAVAWWNDREESFDAEHWQTLDDYISGFQGSGARPWHMYMGGPKDYYCLLCGNEQPHPWHDAPGAAERPDPRQLDMLAAIPQGGTDELVTELETAARDMMADEDWEPSEVYEVMQRAIAALRGSRPLVEPDRMDFQMEGERLVFTGGASARPPAGGEDGERVRISDLTETERARRGRRDMDEAWGHIVRFCAEVGVHVDTSPLRAPVHPEGVDER